jgi:hypothetical protein
MTDKQDERLTQATTVPRSSDGLTDLVTCAVSAHVNKPDNDEAAALVHADIMA